MKDLKKDGIILGIITAIVLFFVLKDDFTSVVDLLLKANIIWIILAITMEALTIIFQALSFYQIVKSYKSNYKFSSVIKLMIVTKFFNGITPFSTGGQPLQIYMLNKEGIRLTKATNMIIQNFILYQMALVTYGIVAIALNYKFHLFANVPVLRRLILLGFAINTAIVVLLAIISFSNKFNKFCVNKGIWVLEKLHIVKNRKKQEEKWEEKCNDFHEGATYLLSNKTLCIKGYIYNLISLTANYITPLFIIFALSQNINITTINPMTTIVSSAYIMIIGSFVPIPGASGGIEYGYMRFFGNFISGTLLTASLLIWRFVTYYLPMVVGGIIFSLLGKEEKKS